MQMTSSLSEDLEKLMSSQSGYLKAQYNSYFGI